MDPWEIIKLDSIKKTCRICLEERKIMNNIYHNDNIYQMSVVELLNNYLWLKIEENEELSSSICIRCEAEVFQICEFKLKFDKSNTYCQEYLRQLANANSNKEHIIQTSNVEDDEEDRSVINEPPVKAEEVLGDVALDANVLEFVEDSSDEIEVEPKQIVKAKRKAKSVEGKPAYSCNTCKETFESKIKLMDHRRKLLHYTRKTVTCPQCKLLVPVQNYRSHFLKHASNLKCEACDRTFSNNFNLKRHLYLHTNQTPFICDLCGAKFARQDKLKAHVMIHTCEKPYTCEACGQQFRLKDKLKHHQERSCSGGASDYSEKYKRTLSCEICSKSFTLLSSLRTHKLLHTDDRVICSACGKPYPNERKLKEHKLLVHSEKANQEKEFLCNICAKQYSNKAILKRHILTHLGLTKSYNCKVCNKSFTQSGSLALHMKIHTGEKPFVCHVCSKAFNKPNNLQRHLRSHDNIRPYVCALCEKCFSVKHSLTVHTRIHTGEKPFDCPVCAKKFVDRGSLTKHIKIHNGHT